LPKNQSKELELEHLPNRIFVMTQQVLSSRQTKGSKELCNTCGIKIKVGDTVVTKIGNMKHSRPIRHESCARRVGVID